MPLLTPRFLHSSLRLTKESGLERTERYGRTLDNLSHVGCVNPILTRRGNTLLPRQPIRRTWGQLGEQLDRVVGAAGFVHRRKTKEATVSE